MLVNYLLEATAKTGTFPTYFVLVYVVGFIAAVTIGSMAWYSSKKPAGWENVQKPDFVPDITSSDKKEDKEENK